MRWAKSPWLWLPFWLQEWTCILTRISKQERKFIGYTLFLINSLVLWEFFPEYIKSSLFGGVFTYSTVPRCAILRFFSTISGLYTVEVRLPGLPCSYRLYEFLSFFYNHLFRRNFCNIWLVSGYQQYSNMSTLPEGFKGVIVSRDFDSPMRDRCGWTLGIRYF